MDQIKIELTGHRNDGETTVDVVSLDPEQWDLLLRTLREKIREIEQQTCWRVRPNLVSRRAKLIEVLCRIDI